MGPVAHLGLHEHSADVMIVSIAPLCTPFEDADAAIRETPGSIREFIRRQDAECLKASATSGRDHLGG